MADKSSAHERTRLWAAVVYPDSAPENWRSLIDEAHVEWAESPLHDLDVNEATGEVKKPHWHIVLSFDGPKSFEQVVTLLAPVNCPIPQRCHSLRGAVRYFVHMDNPEKHQYSVADIVCHGGFDITAALAPSASERYAYIKQMEEWCIDTGCIEFADLFDYSAHERADDWFPLLCDSCAFVMTQFLKSRRHRAQPVPQAGQGGPKCNGGPPTGLLLD